MIVDIKTSKQPDIRPHSESGEARYILNEDYRFSLKYVDGHRRYFKVPKGFLFDGASVPRLFMFLIGLERDGVHRAGSLIHDYIYRNKGVIKSNCRCVFRLTRKQGDQLFYKVNKDRGLKSWHNRIAYLTVRGFGWLHARF